MVQEIGKTIKLHASITYGCAGLIPADKTWDKIPYSAIIQIFFKECLSSVIRSTKVNEVHPLMGIFMQYSNPLTGGHVMQNYGSSYAIITSRFQRKHTNTGSRCTNAPKEEVTPSSTETFRIGKKEIFSAFRVGRGTNITNPSETEDALLIQFQMIFQ